MFRYNVIPLTNKPTRVTRHSANGIDHIITNSVTGHNDFKSAIIKTDLSDHFPIVFAIKTNETMQRSVVKSIYKRSLTVKKILTNLKILCPTEIGWHLKIEDPTRHINTFSLPLLTFITIRFQNRKLKLNSRVSPWINKEIAKSSKKETKTLWKILKE